MAIAKLLTGGILICGLVVAGGCRGPAVNGDPVAPSGAPLVISDGSAKGWRAQPADGVTMALADDDGALRLDFGFTGGGYAIARREVDVALPQNYAFSFRLRGACPVNTLEFKLVDETGENVWWRVERAIEFPAQWRTVTIKKRQLEFAWGPGGGAPLRGISAVEIVVTAAEGGSGSVWIDDLTLRELPPPTAVDAAPVATATTGDAAAALDGDAATFWTPDKTDRSPALDLDFGGSREFGGLQLDWRPDRHALDYVVEASDDGQTWRQLTIVSGSDGGRDHLYLPEGEARRLRLLLLRSSTKFPPELAGITVMPLAWSRTREAFLAAVAAESPRGCYPRGIGGEQVYWTVVGRDADPREVLFDEDGGLETGPYRGAVEPFLRTDGRLLTWADAETRHELVDGFLPMPSVRRRTGDLDLTVAAYVSEEPGLRGVVARYRVINRGPSPRTVDLDLAIRPFQVNPPSQTLNRPGGAAPIRTLAQSGGVVFLDGVPAAIALTPGGRFGAVNFHGGDVVADHLRHGRLPAARSTTCDFGGASGALSWPFDLAPGDSAEVVVLVDPDPNAPPPPPLSADEATSVRRRGPRGLPPRLARPPRRHRHHRPARGARGARNDARAARLRAGQPRGRGHPARHAQLPALLDPRRLADGLGPAADGPDRAGRRLPGVVRAAPVPRRQDPLRGGPPRRRPGARARQQRRVHLPGRRGLAPHRRPRAAAADVAARRRRRRLPGRPAPPAPHRRVANTGQARVLRPAAALDQPRGLLRQAHALLLGRLLRPARLPRRRGPGRRPGPGRRAGAADRDPRRVRRRPARLDRRRHGAPRRRLRAGLRRPRRLRRHLDHHRPDPDRRRRAGAPGRDRAHLREVLGVLRRPPRRRPVGCDDAVRDAHHRRLRAPGLARPRARAGRLLPVAAPAGRLARVGRGRRPRGARAALPRRHAPHLGRHGLRAVGAGHVRLRRRGERRAGDRRGGAGGVAAGRWREREGAGDGVRTARLHAAARRRDGDGGRRWRVEGAGGWGRAADAPDEGGRRR
ncbi:MAG: discoidin domain-containing protein [bacterium]|nr:discoidin domain-containing protein [bacterium]